LTSLLVESDLGGPPAATAGVVAAALLVLAASALVADAVGVFVAAAGALPGGRTEFWARTVDRELAKKTAPAANRMTKTTRPNLTFGGRGALTADSPLDGVVTVRCQNLKTKKAPF
jgi:hypothetical protein